MMMMMMMMVITQLTTPCEGISRDNERNNPYERNSVKNPIGGRQTSWQTSVAEELNWGLPRTIPANAQSGTGTWDLLISRPAA